MKTTRRSFIQKTALLSGVFSLGFDWFESKANSGIMQQMNPALDASRFNAFLSIENTGKIILYSPNPEIGQGIKTAFPIVVAEELDVDWKQVEVRQANLDTQLFERQLTGGSGALKHSWERLRKAGATARHMLIQAAAQQWGVDASTCKTSKGFVLGPNKGQKLAYGALVDAASKLSVPTEVTYKSRADYQLIGSFVKGVDNYKVLTGKPQYGLDTQKSGMLIAQIVRPPAFGSTLVSFDAAEVKKMPGIIDVVSFKNKVAVVGKSTWEVMQARKKLVCNYSDTSNLESDSTHQKWFDEGMKTDKAKVERKDGDFHAAIAKAAKVIEATYECPFLSHTPMEPMNFFADVRPGSVLLAGPTQVPQSAQKAVATLLGVPENTVQVELTKMGGGFGRRLNNDYALEAAELSSIIKMPVKVMWTREDDMTGGIYRPAVRYHFKAGLNEKGEMIAFYLRGVGLNAGNSTRQDNFPVGAIDNVLIESFNYNSAITTGPWRAPITNFLASAEQSFLDEVAVAAGKDPIQMRLDWLQKVKTNPVGKITYEPDRFIEVIKQVAEKAKWGKKGANVHQGFSVYFSHLSYVAQIAEAKMVDGEPKVTHVTAVTDCGEVINRSGAENQVIGGIIDGYGHAMFSKLSFDKGVPQQKNFDTYKLIRGNEIPTVEAHFVNNGIAPTGLGEPALPPTGGAVANALFAATKKRLYRQPFAGPDNANL
ncbi:xanthine dehydrogenase family protein molybdopterin-binding subunit [Aquirufa ecclesiirivi]|uniref:xanthine dehydrogenase family protein molybdopterin-binding subunit n=1 Tax=Aquirufa ecclesiirivi TaxID=2715124 RepID=UPI0022A8BFBD|nr:molybdopterin cofactor-binding domain-containing protein [Aquirufa ecclesiirivi]MCZ2472752.1 xanthine dehydrogenase family protein molybdopterin-binding subunit [Aquirufa ecclesiirivi]